MAASSHSDLYKQFQCSQTESVSRRRDHLLAQQKLHRQTSNDGQRNIQELLEALSTSTAQYCRRRNKRSLPKYKNKLQLSEWLTERPNDFDNWFLVGCPKGNRCMVVATGGKTLVYGKNGGFIRKLHTHLPGDAGNQQEITILDCIYAKETNKYWVLDALAYGKFDFTNCDFLFRFFWIASRVQDDDLGNIHRDHEAPFKGVRFVDCADMDAMNEMLSTYPMYENNSPEVDGFLFYHKESLYVQGTTPLVGWLYPFMVPEVLKIGSVHPSWMAMRPEDYVDSGTYIEQFNASQKKKSTRRKERHLEIEENDEADENEMDVDLYLEKTGKCLDDVYNDEEIV